MAALSLLVIFIACVNFITLSTSQALGRFREIGVRKTLGALVGQLRRQLVIESFFICLISGLIGLILAAILLHPFGRLIESELHFSIGAFEIAFLLGLLLVIATITGLLQAAIIVRKHTQDALSGKVRLAGGKKWFNDSLNWQQGSAYAIVLLIASITIVLVFMRIFKVNMGDIGK